MAIARFAFALSARQIGTAARARYSSVVRAERMAPNEITT